MLSFPGDMEFTVPTASAGTISGSKGMQSHKAGLILRKSPSEIGTHIPSRAMSQLVPQKHLSFSYLGSRSTSFPFIFSALKFLSQSCTVKRCFSTRASMSTCPITTHSYLKKETVLIKGNPYAHTERVGPTK